MDPVPSWLAKLPFSTLGCWPCPQQRGAGAGAGEVTQRARTGLGGWPQAVHRRGAGPPCALLFAASLAPQMGFMLLWARTGTSWGQIQTSTARKTPHTKPQRGPAAGFVLHPNLPRLPCPVAGGCRCTCNDDDLFQMFIRTRTSLREARGQLWPLRRVRRVPAELAASGAFCEHVQFSQSSVQPQ